jgi:hypothetical protein
MSLRTAECVALGFVAFPTASTTRSARTSSTYWPCTTVAVVRAGSTLSSAAFQIVLDSTRCTATPWKYGAFPCRLVRSHFVLADSARVLPKDARTRSRRIGRKAGEVQPRHAYRTRAESRGWYGRCLLCGSRSSVAPRPCSAAARIRPSSNSLFGSSSRSTLGDIRGRASRPWIGASGWRSLASGLGGEARS